MCSYGSIYSCKKISVSAHISWNKYELRLCVRFHVCMCVYPCGAQTREVVFISYPIKSLTSNLYQYCRLEYSLILLT